MNHRVVLYCLVFALAGWFTLPSVAACQLPLAQQEEDASKRQRTRELIQQHFPKLDKNSVNGWVDSYSGMSERELIQLLQQRKLMGGGSAGFGDLKLNLPTFDLGTPAEQEAPSEQTVSERAKLIQASVQEGLAIVRRNRFGQKVAGHRCEGFCFTFSGLPDSELDTLTIHKSWDLKPGAHQKTGRPLDLCLIDDGRAMFRLEPGCVLTRCGRFIRLEDGRLGQVVGGKPLAVFPEVRVPVSVKAMQADLATTESATRKKASGQKSQGEFQCVRILDASLLASSNGVYFTVAEEDRPGAFEGSARVRVQTGVLELSNFESQEQQHLQDSLQEISDSLPTSDRR